MKSSKPLRSGLEERHEPGEIVNDAHEGLGACWFSHRAGHSRRSRWDALHRTAEVRLILAQSAILAKTDEKINLILSEGCGKLLPARRNRSSLHINDERIFCIMGDHRAV